MPPENKLMPLFVRMSRTGGTSVSTYLINNELPVKLHESKNKIGPRINQKSHFIFTITRHPFDRYVDTINYILSGDTRVIKFIRNLAVYLNISIDLDLIKFIVKNPQFINHTNLFNQQYDYLKNIKFSKIYKFEDGLDAIKVDLKNKFNINEVVELEHLNAATIVYTVDMLTDEQKQLLTKLYKNDLSIYN